MLGVEPYGNAAFLVTSDRAFNFEERLLHDRPPWLIDVIATSYEVLVKFDTISTCPNKVVEYLHGLSEVTDKVWQISKVGQSHEIEFELTGFDLKEVLERSKSSIVELRDELSSSTFKVAHLGFAPGFVYLDGLGSKFHIQRRESPRTKLPKGSLAIGGKYLGIYPLATPGGWNVIGSATSSFFDIRNNPPMALHRGDTVTFKEVESKPITVNSSPIDTDDIQLVPSGKNLLRFGVVTQSIGNPSFQDLGRFGLNHLGISNSGAMDRSAFSLSNLILGNDPVKATSIEIPIGSTLQVKVTKSAYVAVVGQGATLRIDNHEVPINTTLALNENNVFHISNRGDSAYVYLSIAGGFACDRTLGSTSFDSLSEIGPTLSSNDLLYIKINKKNTIFDHIEMNQTATSKELSVPVMLGPDIKYFSDETTERFLNNRFTISSKISRVGIRLMPDLALRPISNLDRSKPMACGAIQVTPSGEMIIMMRDSPTTGGYPVIGVTCEPWISKIASLLPGASITFMIMGLEHYRSSLLQRQSPPLSKCLRGHRPYDELISMDYKQ
ncbi:carboxyltransferase domain-containing protein [Acidithrix sp. C25]|uniref:5-oxoprolinase subunit B/C family protein n=1 Tax=Acidithrix sp. C25 TaxID=1671482 RepID=UPI00191BA6A0|nr:carboxyltransferase domain-containing protein [Acidithrix sp. C25]CAG4928730.1 unnamed protein product [Acidithrix sp. C25]